MKFIVAIHPDDYGSPAAPDKCDASSPRWAELLRRSGHRVRWVDVRRADVLEQLDGCDAFMWRWAHFEGMGRVARRLLPVIEHQLGLVVYPDQRTCWHYDDKIAQAYLLQAARIPTPETWIWFDRDSAKTWAAEATFPTVLKLAVGAGSTNVRLVKDRSEALVWIDRLFEQRLTDLDERQFLPLGWKQRLRAGASLWRRGIRPSFGDNGLEPQSGYVLFQEFLPDNAFDTRVTVIGRRAFAFRRMNRVQDFRASGGGAIDWNPDTIDTGFVRLGFQAARAIGSQSCAIDGLYAHGQHVTSEISYTYASWAVDKCPGHWELAGDPCTGDLYWVPGHMWPEEAQIEDLIGRLQTKTGQGTCRCSVPGSGC